MKYYIMVWTTFYIPIKTVRIHRNDAPWITGKLKSLIRLRQKAYEQNNNTLYKFYRNLVNKERKSKGQGL